MIKNKLLSAAIRCQLGMYWEAGVFSLNLYVVTAIAENGRQTTRRIASVETLIEALSISKSIFDQGGALIAEALAVSDSKWRFGYDPSNEAQMDLYYAVREKDSATRHQHYQPRWDDFRAETQPKKGNKNHA